MTGYSVASTDPNNALGLLTGTFSVTPDVTGEIKSISGSGIRYNVSYDPAARLVAIDAGFANHTLGVTVNRDSFGRKKSANFSTGLQGNYSFDLLDRITKLTWTGAGANLNEELTYDPQTGNIPY